MFLYITITSGLVSDLAQVPHRLDLSSPHMAATINQCLKPLEVLTRLIHTVRSLDAYYLLPSYFRFYLLCLSFFFWRVADAHCT